MIGYILPVMVSPPVGFVIPRVRGNGRAYLAACLATCFRADPGDPPEAYELRDVARSTAAAMAIVMDQDDARRIETFATLASDILLELAKEERIVVMCLAIRILIEDDHEECFDLDVAVKRVSALYTPTEHHERVARKVVEVVTT